MNLKLLGMASPEEAAAAADCGERAPACARARGGAGGRACPVQGGQAGCPRTRPHSSHKKKRLRGAGAPARASCRGSRPSPPPPTHTPHAHTRPYMRSCHLALDPLRRRRTAPTDAELWRRHLCRCVESAAGGGCCRGGAWGARPCPCPLFRVVGVEKGAGRWRGPCPWSPAYCPLNSVARGVGHASRCGPWTRPSAWRALVYQTLQYTHTHTHTHTRNPPPRPLQGLMDRVRACSSRSDIQQLVFR